MTARDRCSWADDGRHRWRFVGPSAWSAEPRYGCGPSCGVVLVTGDGIAEDAAYLAPDVLVTSCAACDVEGEVGTTILVTDDETALCRRCEADPGTALTLVERYGARCDGCGEHEDVEPWDLPHDVAAYLCLGCSPDEAEAIAELVEAKAAMA
jgi:hypothetical protein